ncbi:MAG: hypothetical protein HPY87_08960 [Fervidobacterium sp.]|uniref:hypothetical protein n=1 Tax=Fervidobacterium sp. TaxID=1871331 RepID=UPI0025C030C5|nr:hypothetical protein [Fervidobacterium sp.]NPU89990.1 hypothetical protein [Fervidobacterium sp.]
MPTNSDLAKIIDNTVQENVRAENEFGLSFITFLSKAADIVAPWWSPRRDKELREFYRSVDHLCGAVFTTTTKISSIPFKIVPNDFSIKSHVRIADQYTKFLYDVAQFGDGWINFISRVVEDLYCQDNGAFIEIIGEGDKSQEIQGMPLSVAHLDSAHCIRTGDPIYPVIYEYNGQKHKLHFSRVIYMSQMPSPDVDMNGVGICAISRALYSAQNLLDMAVYKQEKLGSRPNRRLIITKGGLDPEDIQTAIRLAEENMSSSGLTRYSKTIGIGDRNLQDPSVEVVDLTSMDGFDEENSTIFAMIVIATAFGLDPKELFPYQMSGATKADSVIQHMKQRGRSLGQTLYMLETGFTNKFLPPFLHMEFDYQDDAEDRQVADINNVRATTRQFNINNSVTDVRTERELMLLHGEISREQFVQLELNDGRLDDGTSVEVLFYSDDKDYSEWLANGGNKEEIMKIIVTSKSPEKVEKARKALAAIEYREKKSKDEMNNRLLEQARQQNAILANRQNGIQQAPKGGPPQSTNGVDLSYTTERFSNKKPADLTISSTQVSEYMRK